MAIKTSSKIATKAPTTQTYEQNVGGMAGGYTEKQLKANNPDFTTKGTADAIRTSRSPGGGAYEAPALPTPTPTMEPLQPRGPALEQPSPTETALDMAKNSGVLPPQDSGEARSAIAEYLPQGGPSFYKPETPVEGYDPQTIFNAQGQAVSYDQFIAQGGKPDFSNVQKGSPTTLAQGAIGTSPFVDQQLMQDPGYQQLLADRAEFTAIQNQQQSLTETYAKMTKKLGIETLNTELMNMKNIIEGTEDDIRSEVTKAGGFATDSQVLALTGARNKQLIKNYNNLLETKQMAMETLNTMMGLAVQDRQFAMQSMMQKMQIDSQIIEYQDRMKQNAVNAYQKIIDQVGYAGLNEMTGGNPYYTSLVEKTLGLGAGGLSRLANYAPPLSFDQELDLARFGLEQDKFAWETSQANIPEGFTLGEGQTRYDAYGNPIAGAGVNAGQPSPEQQLQAEDTIKALDNLQNSNRGLNSAVGPNLFTRGTNWFKFATPDYWSGQTQNFIGGVENVTTQIVGKTLTDLKAQGATFGALSDAELQLIQNAATKINAWAIRDDNGKVIGYNIDQNSFKQELDTITNKMKRSYLLSGGDPNKVGVVKTDDGKYWTKNSSGKMNEILNDTYLNQTKSTFNQAGNAGASNQVKGMSERAPLIPLINMDGNPKTPNVPLTQAYPQGSTGGQCGIWVRSIVEKQGKTYPRVGDSLSEKMATAKKYGVPLSQARPGSVILTSENKTTGHVAYIIGRTKQGFVVGESNYGLDGRVRYGRVIPFNSPNILGIINPK